MSKRGDNYHFLPTGLTKCSEKFTKMASLHSVYMTEIGPALPNKGVFRKNIYMNKT